MFESQIVLGRYVYFTSKRLHCKSTEQRVLRTRTSHLSYRCYHSDMETRCRLRRMRGSGGSGGGGSGGRTPNTFSPATRQCVVSAAAVASSPSAFVCARPRESTRRSSVYERVYNVPCFRYRYRGYHHDGRFVVTRFARSSRSQCGRTPDNSVVSAEDDVGVYGRHKTTTAAGRGKRRSRRAATTLMPPSLSAVAAPGGK